MENKCQCKKCGKLFNMSEATGIGVGNKKSPCCQHNFIVVDENIDKFLDWFLFRNVVYDIRYYE